MSGLRSERRKTAALQGRKKISNRFRRKVESGVMGRFMHAAQYRGAKPDVGRNDPCPCGRLKEDGTPMKFKKCCGG